MLQIYYNQNDLSSIIFSFSTKTLLFDIYLMIKDFSTWLISLNEGLIKTHPITKYKAGLENRVKISFPEYHLDIIDDYRFSLSIPYNDINDTDKADSCGMFFGYFVSHIKVLYQNLFEYTFPWDRDLIIKDCESKSVAEMTFYFEPMWFGVEEIEDKTMYHVTRTKHVDSILLKGLCPRTHSKIVYHPSRIYMYSDIGSAKNIVKRASFKKDYKGEHTILKITLSDSQTVYKDPNSNGFYTYKNIHPNQIEVIESF
jgi:hypothetical protein